MSAVPAPSPRTPFLFPHGCHTETPEAFLAQVHRILQEGEINSFRTQIVLAPMPVAHVGRLRRWVERERPLVLHPLCLDLSAEREVIVHFAKNGIHVAVVRGATLPLSYELVALF